MKEIQNFIEWIHSFNGPEPQCESLVEWLEIEEREAYRYGGVIFGRLMLVLLSLVLGMFLAVIASNEISMSHGGRNFVRQAVTFAVGGGLTFAAIAAWLTFGRGKGLRRKERDTEASRAISQLRNVHGYRGLRRELGEHGVLELNEGAQLYLRCRSTLTSAAWAAQSPDDPWAEAGNNLLQAMESAMARLTLYVVRKRSFSDIGPVLDEMRTATNEALKITEQRSLSAGSTGRDLRASLQRMRDLAQAEDELLRVRD